MRIGEAAGYGFWTLIASFGLPGLILYFVLRGVIGSGLVRADALKDPQWTVVLFAGQYLIGLAALLVIPKVVQKLSMAKIKELLGIVRRPVWTDLGIAIAYFIIYFAVATVISILLTAYVPGFDVKQKQDVGFNEVTDVFGLIAAFVALVVLAPVAEELIFRGYLFGNLKRVISLPIAIGVTSVLFGLVHGQWNVGIDVAILSVFLCLLRVKTDAVWAGIFLHMTKNSLAYFALFIAPLMGLRLQ